jgi:HEAT repeat protein
MAQGKGRKIAIAMAALAGGVFVVAVWVFRPLIVEEIEVRREAAKLSSPDIEAMQAAAQRLAGMESPRALRALLEAVEKAGEEGDVVGIPDIIRNGPSRWRSPLPVLVEFLRSGKGDGYLRLWAARKALEIDPRSPAAIDALLALVREGNGYAFDLAESIGADPVPALIAALEGNVSMSRGWAAEMLGEIGPGAAAALPALEAALRDPDSIVRKNARESLLEVGSKENAIRAFTAILRDPIGEVRRNAIEGLKEAGVPRSSYLPRLLKEDAAAVERKESDIVSYLVRFLEEDDSMKFDTLQQLRELGPAALAAAPAVRKAFADPDPEIARLALRTLIDIGDREDVIALLPALASAVDRSPGVFRRQPVRVAQFLEEKAAPLVPHLARWLKSEDEELPRDAAMALGLIGPASRDAAPALAAGLRHADESVAASCAFALLKMGPAAGAALPDLEAARERRMPVLVLWAAGAILAIDPSRKAKLLPSIVEGLDAEPIQAAKVLRNLRGLGREAAPALVDRLLRASGESVSLRNNYLGALEMVGFGDEEMAALAKSLEDPDLWTRYQAAEALGILGARAPSQGALVPPLTKAFGDPEEIVRSSAAVALGNLGPAATPATPSLIDALEDRDETVREAAAEALGKIGPAARAAVPALEAATRERKKAVRHAAKEALEKIVSGR